MSKGDVQIVMAETFVHDVKSLSFSRQYNIIKVADKGDRAFNIQGEYNGQGEYPFSAIVKLTAKNGDNLIDSRYILSGRVCITCDKENSPVVDFLGIISISKC